MVSGADGSLVDEERIARCLYLSQSLRVSISPTHAYFYSDCCSSLSTHPKVDIQIPTSSKFSIADLERDGHAIVLMEILVEALSGVGPQLNVVRIAEGEQRQHRNQNAEKERHRGGW